MFRTKVLDYILNHPCQWNWTRSWTHWCK